MPCRWTCASRCKGRCRAHARRLGGAEPEAGCQHALPRAQQASTWFTAYPCHEHYPETSDLCKEKGQVCVHITRLGGSVQYCLQYNLQQSPAAMTAPRFNRHATAYAGVHCHACGYAYPYRRCLRARSSWRFRNPEATWARHLHDSAH